MARRRGAALATAWRAVRPKPAISAGIGWPAASAAQASPIAAEVWMP